MSYEEQKAQHQLEAGLYHEEHRFNTVVKDVQAKLCNNRHCEAANWKCVDWIDCRDYKPVN